MVIVPILSWTEDGQGSLGELSKIGIDGFDRVSPIALSQKIRIRVIIFSVLPLPRPPPRPLPFPRGSSKLWS